jgi:ribosomal protein L1
MNDEVFNLDLRKFLKRFGVTAQREIERAVRDAIERGTLTGTETIEVRATLTIPAVIAELRIDGQIGLNQPASRDPG